ncbi:hypothetical protein [uncultured Sphingomonas sp.]|uniref:hypothetical protein n=1 Tax=uncultured Sphingomonas sp. TaxID=158754 RepID=UPI00259684F3|nr:hypothetical protein [uncultured Sphingomonas sp.]
MNTNRLSAGASRFAHFAGFTRSSRRASEDDETTDARASEDEEEDGEHAEEDEPKDEAKGKKGGKARSAEDDDSDDEPKGKRGSKASDEDDDAEDEDEEPKARGKKSRRAEDDDDSADAEDDDDKEEMNGRSAKAAARRREQARIAHILGHSAAANNPALAVSLACDTRMTRQEAVAVLKGQAGQQANGHQSRSAREDRNPQLGNSGGSGKQKAGSSWGRSFGKLGHGPRQG